MAFDATNLTYTITSAPDADQNAVVTFGCDDSTQTIHLPDVGSADVVTQFLDEYTKGYVAGKQVEQAVAADVANLVNQQQTAS